MLYDLAAGDMRDFYLGYQDSVAFQPQVETVQVPFSCPASVGKVVPAQPRFSQYGGAKMICPGCQRNRHILVRIGWDLNNLCFFCTQKSGQDVGLDATARIKRTRARYEEKEHQGRIQLAYPTPQFMRTTASPNPENMRAALHTRALATTPKIENDDVLDVFVTLRNHFFVLFPGVLVHPFEWLTFFEWVAGCGISTQNLKRIIEAFEWFDGLGRAAKDLVLNALTKAFVKRDNDKLGFRARLIQGMEEIITMITGPVIASIQKFFENHALPSNIFFSAGKTHCDLSAWKASIPAGMAAYNLDMTNYDSNIKGPIIDMIMYIYHRLFKFWHYEDPKYLELVLNHQKRTMEGKTKYFKFKVDGTTKSGSLDTCYGNSMANILLILHAVARCVQKPAHELVSQKLIWMAVMGDDNLLYVPEDWDLSMLETHLQEMGMQPKCGREQIFLNMMPVPLGKPLSRVYEIVMSSGMGKTTFCRSHPGVFDPDDYFCPGITTAEKYANYQALIRSSTSGVFFHHDLSTVCGDNVVVVDEPLDLVLQGVRGRPERDPAFAAFVAQQNWECVRRQLAVTPRRTIRRCELDAHVAAAFAAIEKQHDSPEHVFSLLPGRLLARLFHTTAQYTKVKQTHQHLAGLYICLYPQLHHDPIMAPLMRRVWELTGKECVGVTIDVQKAINLRYKMLLRARVEPTPVSDAYYMKRYACEPRDLASWAAWCATSNLGSVVLHPLALRAMEVDLAAAPAD